MLIFHASLHTVIVNNTNYVNDTKKNELFEIFIYNFANQNNEEVVRNESEMEKVRQNNKVKRCTSIIFLRNVSYTITATSSICKGHTISPFRTDTSIDIVNLNQNIYSSFLNYFSAHSNMVICQYS